MRVLVAAEAKFFFNQMMFRGIAVVYTPKNAGESGATIQLADAQLCKLAHAKMQI